MTRLQTSGFIAIAALILTYVGASILFTPLGFYAANGTDLTPQPSILSEVRASGGLLLGSGIAIFLSLRGCLQNRFFIDWERGGMRFETRGGSVFAGIRNRRATKKLARPAPRYDELEFSDRLFIPTMRRQALGLSSLVYLTYGFARVFSMLLDGMPSMSLTLSAGVEILIGTLSALVWTRTTETIHP